MSGSPRLTLEVIMVSKENAVPPPTELMREPDISLMVTKINVWL